MIWGERTPKARCRQILAVVGSRTHAIHPSVCARSVRLSIRRNGGTIQGCRARFNFLRGHDWLCHNLMPERPKLSTRGADCCKMRDRTGSLDQIDSGVLVFHSLVWWSKYIQCVGCHSWHGASGWLLILVSSCSLFPLPSACVPSYINS